MNRKHALDGFHFKNQLRPDDKVEAQAVVDLDAIIDDGKLNLSLHTEPTLCQLMMQAGFIDALEKPRTQRSVNLERRAQHAMRKLPRRLSEFARQPWAQRLTVKRRD